MKKILNFVPLQKSKTASLVIKPFLSKISFSTPPESIQEINPERNDTFTSRLKRLNYDLNFDNELIKSLYFLGDTKNSSKSGSNSEKLKKILSAAPEEKGLMFDRLLLELVKNPSSADYYFSSEEFNASNLMTILRESSLVQNLENGTVSQKLSYESITAILKYIKMLINNFPIVLNEPDLAKIIKNCLSDTVTQSLDYSVTKQIDLLYEVTRIKDKLTNLPSDPQINSSMKNFLIASVLNSNQSIIRLLRGVLISEQIDQLNFNTQFFKLIFTLSKAISLKPEFSFNTFLSNSLGHSSNQEVKDKLFVYLSTLRLHTDLYFRNNEEKTILFYLCLNKLSLLTRSLVRQIKFEFLSLECFHVMFSLLLNKSEYINEINLKSVEEMMNKLRVKRGLQDMDFNQLYLMRESLDWYLSRSLGHVTFHNQLGTLQFFAKRRVTEVLGKITQSVSILTDPNQIVYSAYFLTKYFCDPENEFSKLAEKSFEIEKVNGKLLNDFLNALDYRLEYSTRYDHEIFILNKFKKDFFVPYNSNLDKFVISLTNQFLKIIESDRAVSEDLFTAGIKLLSVIFKNDSLNPYYSLADSVKQSLTTFSTKCFQRGSKYIKQFNNVETVVSVLSILPFLKFYDPALNEQFDLFVLNLVKKDYSKEDKLKIVNLASEYLTLSILQSTEGLTDNTSNTSKHPKIFSDIITYIHKLSENMLKEEELRQNDSSAISTLLNLYNLFSLDKDKYDKTLVLISNLIKDKNGLRSLKGYSLLKLNKELMNENTLLQVLSNLQTIQIAKNKKENLISAVITTQSLKNYLNDILDSLTLILQNDPDKKSISSFNFSSFSYLVSTISESLSHPEIIKILKILGTKKVENYHPQFMKNLVGMFSDRELLFTMMKKKEEDFFALALSWPIFIKNEELIRTILHCHISKLLQFSRYEIISLLTHNRINHIKLFNFLGKAINKIKNPKMKKKVLMNFINNCNHVGYKVDLGLYEEMLSIFSALKKGGQSFTVQEMTDFLVLSVISNILDTSLSKENKHVYFELLESITKTMAFKLEVSVEGNAISYYPSISSDERTFQKSLSSVTNKEATMQLTAQNLTPPVQNEEEEPEGKKEEEETPYMKKTGEGFYTLDSEFENYFLKKKELMYGHQAYLKDSLGVRDLMKKWLISKLFLINLEDEHLESQLEHILTHSKKDFSHNENYEKFYLKLLSFGFQNNFILESDYKDPHTRLKIDYSIQLGDKRFYIVIVPEEYTSTNIEENRQHADGVYTLFFECIKRAQNVTLISILQSQLANFSDSDYQNYIMNKILGEK